MKSLEKINNKKKINTRKILICIALVGLALICIFFLGVGALRCSGKKSLYKEQNNNKMKFTSKYIEVVNDKEYDVVYEGEKYKYNERILTFLVLGIDKNEKVSPAKNGVSGGQSDGIFLVVMNPDTKKIDIIMVHRDTVAKLQIYNKEGQFEKEAEAQICLQHAYGDGMELSNNRTKDAVSKLFCELPIHSVTSVNMGAVGEINDAIGGVTLESLESFEVDGFEYKEGENVTLTGMSAYYYTKYRNINEHCTAEKRLLRQKQYLSKATEQLMKTLKKDVGIFVDIYNTVDDYVVTDLSVDEMTYIATEAVSYSFGEIYSPSGSIDTSGYYEKFYVDIDEFEAMIIRLFYEKVN